MKPARSKQFNVRLNKAEWAQVSFLAEYFGISAASVIRMLLKEEERRIEAENQRKSARPIAPKAR